MIDKQVKFKLILFVVLVSLTVLFAVCVFLESLGVFPGSLLNKMSVQRYINESYPELDYEVENYYYDKKQDRYIFNFTSPNGNFTITSKSLEIFEDGYFEKYLKDKSLIDNVQNVIFEKIKNKIPVTSVIFNYGIKKETYKDSTEVLEKLKGKYELVINVTGERLSFDEYRALAAEYATIFNKEGIDPNVLQIFYSRVQDEGESNTVLQYESKIDRNLLVLDKNIITNSTDTHFIVELDEKQLEKYKVYTFFQKFYLVFLLLSIVILSSIWVFKKYKKIKKGKTVSCSDG